MGKLSNLVDHYKGKLESNDTIFITLNDTVVAEVDNVDDVEKRFAWSNKYLALNGLINEDTLTLQYHYSTDFTLTSYYKQKGFFAPKDLVTDISFKDPNMRTTEFKGFKVVEPKKTFFQTTVGKMLIGVAAGYGLSQLN